MSNAKARLTPAEAGAWVFIFADMCIFALYFFVFAYEKQQLPEVFAAGQATLNNLYGAINTIVLLISSYFIAVAVHAARANKTDVFKRSITLTIICGLIFLTVKTFEYTEKFNAGFHIASNEFYRNYFAFTGFHMVHVFIGLSLLIYLLLTINNNDETRHKLPLIEGGALYWHMVDLLWVVLFSLIYLVP